MFSFSNLYLLFLPILMAMFPETYSRIYQNSVQLSYTTRFQSLMKKSFGFLNNSEVHFSMQCPLVKSISLPTFYILLCSSSGAKEFSLIPTVQVRNDCLKISAGSGEVTWRENIHCKSNHIEYNVTSAASGEYNFAFRVRQVAFYTVILLHCPKLPVLNLTEYPEKEFCQSNLVILNPGEKELGSDELCMPLIYLIINLSYAVLMMMWFFNWVVYFKFSNRLHRLISCAPIFKTIQSVLMFLWWQEVSNTGMESVDLTNMKQLVVSTEDALLFITQMLIAEGWGVIHSEIKHYKWTSLLLLFIVFMASLFCVRWVHNYFFAFSVCCIVFMLYKTLKESSRNIDLLRRRRRKVRRFIARYNLRYKGPITIDSQICKKLNIYRKFMIACATFSMLYAIAHTMSTFLQEYTYVRALTFEIPKFLIYAVTLFLFRLTNFDPYDNIELVSPREDVVVFELPDVCMKEIDPHYMLGTPVHFKVEKETQTPRRRKWCTTVRLLN